MSQAICCLAIKATRFFIVRELRSFHSLTKGAEKGRMKSEHPVTTGLNWCYNLQNGLV